MSSLKNDEIIQERQRKESAQELLPNRWLVAVGAGLFLGLKSTGFGFEMNPIRFYQLFLETVKYICLSLVVVSVWMTMFRFFVGKFKGELLWFAILMLFLFSTEAFASLFMSFSRQFITYDQQILKQQENGVTVKPTSLTDILKGDKHENDSGMDKQK